MSSLITKIIIGVVLVGAVAYVVFEMTSDDPAPSSLTETGITAGEVASDSIRVSSNEFLASLREVNAITLDTSLFTRPEFRVLSDPENDNAVTLVQTGDEGRPNPFAQIGSDSINAQGVALQISVDAPTKLTQTGAQFSGTITGATSKLSIERWFEYGPTAMTSSQTPHTTKAGSAFSATIDDLVPSTLYYVRAVMKVNDKEYRSSVKTFRTLGLDTN